MKKVIALSVVLLSIAVGGAYVYYYQPFTPEKPIESVLPKDSLMVIRCDHLKENIQRFRESRLGHALENLDLEKALATPGRSQSRIKEAKKKRDDFINALESRWFDTLFSETTALALLPVDASSLTPENPKAIAESLVLISRTRHPATLVSSIGGMFAEDIDVQTEKHAGWEISHFERQSDDPIYFASSGKLLFMALAPGPIAACLEVDAGKSDPLTTHPQYLELKTDLYDAPDTQFSAYLDGIALAKLIIDASQAHGADPEEIAIIEKQLRGFKAMGFAAYDDLSDTLHRKALILLDKETLDPLMAKILTTQPDVNNTLKMIPGDPLVFNWQNSYSPENFWEILKAQENFTPEELDELHSATKENLGVTFDDLLGAFGKQFCFVLNDVATNGLFPLPELAVVGEVKKEAVINRMVSTVTEKSGLELKEDKHEETQIHYAVIPMVPGITPAYACKDGFCIMATNQELLKTMLNNSDSTPRIKANSAFMAVNKGLTDKNNQVIYIQFASLVGKLRELINWGTTFAGMTDPKGAETAKSNITHVVNPLLSGLEMYETIGLRSQSLNGGEKIQVDGWIQVNREPLKASE